MKVEIISVGEELLLGNRVNTNAAFLAQECAKLGLFCTYQTTVGEDGECLQECLQLAMNRADLILLSAPSVLARKVLTEETKAQGAVTNENNNAAASDIIIEIENNTLILLPESPAELRTLYFEQVQPYVRQKSDSLLVTQTVKICGMSERQVAEMVEDLMDKQENPTITPCAETGEVHLRVTAQAADEKRARKLLKPVVKELKERFDRKIYTTDPDLSLEQAIVDLLIANKLTIATAESCTGGLLAGRLINVAGISDIYKVGHITYSNKAKRRILGVRRGTLDKYGAVSAQTAREMAKGAAMTTKADVTVSVTGIAGPGGGTEDKPVGLVYIGCCVKGDVTVKEYRFSGSRSQIRENTVAAALNVLRECVLEYISEVTFGKKK